MAKALTKSACQLIAVLSKTKPEDMFCSYVNNSQANLRDVQKVKCRWHELAEINVIWVYDISCNSQNSLNTEWHACDLITKMTATIKQWRNEV